MWWKDATLSETLVDQPSQKKFGLRAAAWWGVCSSSGSEKSWVVPGTAHVPGEQGCHRVLLAGHTLFGKVMSAAVQATGKGAASCVLIRLWPVELLGPGGPSAA